MQRKFKSGSASSIKKQEHGRLNTAYTEISDLKKFEPIKDVIYIWAYTKKKDETSTLIIGIEEPWQYPQAFHSNSDEKLHDTLNNLKVENVEGFGHPTIVINFSESGEVEEGEAYIAGELYYDKSKESWYINNKSGRFHSVQTEEDVIKELMKEVTGKFKQVELPVKIKVLKQPLFYPAQMWKKAVKHANDRWHSENIFNIQIEALRIILKHSQDSGISSLLKKQLKELALPIKSLIENINGDLTGQQASHVNVIFKDVKHRMKILESESKDFTEFDKTIITAIQEQIKFLHEKLSVTNTKTSVSNDFNPSRF